MLEQAEATGLEHIETEEFNEALLQQHCIDWSVGPVKITACIDISVPSASIELFLMGRSIGKCVVNPSNPNCRIGGSVDGFKAEITVSLDGTSFRICLELCAPVVGCKKLCRTF